MHMPPSIAAPVFPMPCASGVTRVFHIEVQAARRQRLFVDELDYSATQAVARECLGRPDLALLSHCLLPDRVVLLVAGSLALVTARLGEFQTRHEALYRARHCRVPPLAQVRMEVVAGARSLARLCRQIPRLPVRCGLADTPAAWGWLGPIAGWVPE